MSSIWDCFREALGGASTDVDLDDLDCQPDGDYVSEDRYAKFYDRLDDGECIQYIIRGRKYRLAGPNVQRAFRSGERSNEIEIQSLFPVWMAITDQRILLRLPKMNVSEGLQLITNPHRTISYAELTGVDLDRQISLNQMILMTYSQQRHFVSVVKPEVGECNDAVEFIEKKMAEAWDPGTEASVESDPLDRLDKLKDLHDAGTISDAEFEEMKAELLDQV